MPDQAKTNTGMLKAIFNILTEILFFWQLRLYAWWTSKPRDKALTETLNDSRVFEEWEAAAFLLDELRGNDLWRQNPTSKHYDYRLIYERLQAIIEAREDDDILGLVNLFRSGLVRNLGNITAPHLFSRAYAGTKLLIEDYITQVALAIGHVAAYPTSATTENGLTSQAKLDLLHDTRQAFGRSALVLQGGSIFGLCHIGVVKALHRRGLLPRIIVGTGTGALIAALVGVHTEDELLNILNADSIDLSAFANRSDKQPGSGTDGKDTGLFATFLRRIRRFLKEGYFLDVSVLEQCVRSNVGNMTFEEAYGKTKRVLNITISTADGNDIPGLLNYLTAPNVVIWSAAVASNASASRLYSPVTLQCKGSDSQLHPWSSRPTSPQSSRRPSNAYPISTLPSPAQSDIRDTPLSRVAELFNVNDFVISQARPSIAPFLQTTNDTLPRHTTATARRRDLIWAPLRRIIVLECQHRLRQLATLGILPPGLARLMLDDTVPGASLTIVPELNMTDFFRLLETPTKAAVEAWILRGERSVWPAVNALKVRCTIEFELDRAYQLVRRRKPLDALGNRSQEQLKGSGEKRRRRRASSLGNHADSRVAKLETSTSTAS